MGCANSKQSSSSSRSKCKHCQSPYSPLPRRSYSMHVHHPPQVQDDTYHVVALTSTTLGSLKLETTIDTKNLINSRLNGYATITNSEVDQRGVGVGGDAGGGGKQQSIEFSLGVIEAKTWSEMISEKIPKIIPRTPTRTPPGEPETINAWELMEGLDDLSPLRPANHLRSFSFNVVPTDRSHHDSFDRPKSRFQDNGPVSPKQEEKTTLADSDLSSAKSKQQNSWDRANRLLHQMENNNPNSKLGLVLSDFDPDVLSTFRKSLEDLSPNNPFYLRGSPNNDKPSPLTPTITTDKTLLDATELKKCIPFPKVKDKVIIYFTSLRGIRKTYEDCCLVRVIIKGFNVRVDERDVSMHSGFKDELKELLGDNLRSGVGLNLPRVFIGRKYMGGADEIRKLNEEGQLEKMFECCEKLDDGDYDDDGVGNESGCGRRSRVCDACGDVRFVPCETCSGSCKIYYGGGSDYESEEKSEYSGREDDEDDEKEREEEQDDVEYGFRRCPDCNENGLIRCPICCD